MLPSSSSEDTSNSFADLRASSASSSAFAICTSRSFNDLSVLQMFAYCSYLSLLNGFIYFSGLSIQELLKKSEIRKIKMKKKKKIESS